MGKPLSMDLRARALAAVDAGMSRRVAARRFGVGVSSVIRWGEGPVRHRFEDRPERSVRNRQSCAEGPGRRHALAADRSAERRGDGRPRGGARPDAGGALRPARHTRDRHLEVRAVAVLPSPRHHAESKEDQDVIQWIKSPTNDRPR